MPRKRKHKVFCSGCANLFYSEVYTRPVCVAAAYFVSGALRSKIDVAGAQSAEIKNRHNNCNDRVSVSISAYKIKRWMLWRMNDGSEKKFRAAKLKDYPIDDERPTRDLEETLEEDLYDPDKESPVEVKERATLEDYAEGRAKKWEAEECAEVEGSEGDGVYVDGGDGGSDDDDGSDERDDTSGG